MKKGFFFFLIVFLMCFCAGCFPDGAIDCTGHFVEVQANTSTETFYYGIERFNNTNETDIPYKEYESFSFIPLLNFDSIALRGFMCMIQAEENCTVGVKVFCEGNEVAAQTLELTAGKYEVLSPDFEYTATNLIANLGQAEADHAADTDPDKDKYSSRRSSFFVIELDTDNGSGLRVNIRLDSLILIIA